MKEAKKKIKERNCFWNKTIHLQQEKVKVLILFNIFFKKVNK